jgi:CrcB protein
VRGLLAVAVGGALGSVARYGVGLAVQRALGASFPWGTLAVNVVGCFLIGVVLHAADERGGIAPTTRLFLATGLLGGFTTFSAFGLETFLLARGRDLLVASANVGASVALGLAAVWLGRALAVGLGRGPG